MIDTRFAPYGAFALRIALGAMFLAHAYLKLAIFTPAGFSGFLAQQGLPTVLAWPIMIAEIAAGLALIAGFHGRIASILLLPVLLGAISVHAPNGWLFTAANGGWEYPAFLALTAFAQALIGDGAFALTSNSGSRQAALGTA